MVQIVERHEWGMPAIGANHEIRDLKVATEANVHHSDSERPSRHNAEGQLHDCYSAVLGFDSYHRGKGWACIGYHRVICAHGLVFQGRPLGMVPAAAENHNENIVAYCFIARGNQQATPEQWQALLEMIHHDERRIDKRMRHPRSLKLTTHREVEPPGYTECPGDGIEHQVQQYRRAH